MAEATEVVLGVKCFLCHAQKTSVDTTAQGQPNQTQASHLESFARSKYRRESRKNGLKHKRSSATSSSIGRAVPRGSSLPAMISESEGGGGERAAPPLDMY